MKATNTPDNPPAPATIDKIKRLPPSRLLVGASHIPRAFFFLITNPRLWPLAALPVVLTALLVFGGLVIGTALMPRIVEALSRHIENMPWFLQGFSWLGIAAGTVAAFTLFGFAVALLCVGPILERLSEAVERVSQGWVSEPSGKEAAGGWRGVGEALRASRYFLARVPVVFVLGLVPIVGPLLGLFWAAHSLAFQQTDTTLSRQGLSFEHRRAWHRRYRMQSVGFGLAGVAFLLIPVANLFLMPTIVVGATRLALALPTQSRP